VITVSVTSRGEWTTGTVDELTQGKALIPRHDVIEVDPRLIRHLRFRPPGSPSPLHEEAEIGASGIIARESRIEVLNVSVDTAIG
jgi:hypothetical protein